MDSPLSWPALRSGDDDATRAAPVPAHDAGASAVLEGAEDDAFARLDELPPFHDATPALSAEEEQSDAAEPLAASRTAPLHRLKRKNFSKHLQFLSLRKYAAHAQTHGRLPNRSECELLLRHSFDEFIEEGGSERHPRLAYADFLKLIRNRSREQRQSTGLAHATTLPLHSAGSRGQGDGAKKRKRVSEYDAKIAELIDVIDRARSSRCVLPSSPPGDIVDTMLRLQEETRSVQQQIQERLSRLQQRYGPHEPPSASV